MNVLLEELHPVRDPEPLRGAVRAIDQILIDVHAHPAGLVAHRRREDDAPVARAQVHDVVARLDSRQIEHRIDDLLRRRHIGTTVLDVLRADRV